MIKFFATVILGVISVFAVTWLGVYAWAMLLAFGVIK